MSFNLNHFIAEFLGDVLQVLLVELDATLFKSFLHALFQIVGLVGQFLARVFTRFGSVEDACGCT